MKSNRYAGVVEPWKVRLVTQRARHRGYRGDDLDEVVHRIVLQLVQLQYCAESGASEAAAVRAVADRQLSMYHRSESRYQRRVESVSHVGEPTVEPIHSTQQAMDVRQALAELPELTQRICRALADGLSINETARKLGISWHTVQQHVESARRHFEQAGLGRTGSDSEEDTAG